MLMLYDCGSDAVRVFEAELNDDSNQRQNLCMFTWNWGRDKG
jgi:hypothetical protein